MLPVLTNIGISCVSGESDLSAYFLVLIEVSYPNVWPAKEIILSVIRLKRIPMTVTFINLSTYNPARL